MAYRADTICRMPRLSSWDLIFRPGGWICAQSTDEGTAVYLRVHRCAEGPSSRLNVHLATMASEKPISSHVWRFVPIEYIEQLANEQTHRAVLELEQDGDAPDGESMASYFVPREERQSSLAALGPCAADHALRRTQNGVPAPALQPPGRKITDEFLREVAAAYTWLVHHGQAPAPEIARQTEAPVRTVHRWIVSARKRGFLAPGRAGRKG